MHTNDGTDVGYHAISIVNGANNINTSSSTHKTEDILLSSSAMPLPNSVTNMMLPGNDMIMHQNVSQVLQHFHNMHRFLLLA